MTVINIQRLSTEDGPGMRTTVFLKGCTLSCSWCHNPESLSFKKQVQWVETGRCIGCGICINACPKKALSATFDGIRINRELCGACGGCVEACPTNALERKGEDWNADALIQELLKDQAYFGTDGGITFSGGECLAQSDVVAYMLEKFKTLGIHTAVDTAACVPEKAVDAVLPVADLILLDLKLWDPLEHKKYTGVENGLILENAKRIAAYIRSHESPRLWIRTPIIPNATDTPMNIHSIGVFIKENLEDVVDRWELCAFNNLCKNDYERLDMVWDFAESKLLTVQKMDELLQVALQTGLDPSKVLWTGSTNDEG